MEEMVKGSHALELDRGNVKFRRYSGNVFIGNVPFLILSLPEHIQGMRPQRLVRKVGFHDWPVLFNIIFLTGIITIIGQIILDVIYAMLDPRIKLST